MYGGELCNSFIINITSLHFFFHIPALSVGTAQCHHHCPYKHCSWRVSPVNSKVVRQYNRTVDYFLNFSIVVPLLTNLWLRFVGAENHNNLHCRGHGTSISKFSASSISFSFKVTLVSVIHSMFPYRTFSHRSYTFHSANQQTRSKERIAHPFFFTPSSHLVH